MNEFERAIWAAAYSSRYMQQLAFFEHSAQEACAFNCAEYADEAVKDFRNTINNHPDRDLLFPLSENWPGVK